MNINSTPKVQYAFSEMAGGANHSRATSLTYPNGRVLDYVYGSGLETTISRLTSLSSNSTTLESLSYLGLATVVKRAHPQPGVDLTYIGTAGDGGDQYAGDNQRGRESFPSVAAPTTAGRRTWKIKGVGSLFRGQRRQPQPADEHDLPGEEKDCHAGIGKIKGVRTLFRLTFEGRRR